MLHPEEPKYTQHRMLHSNESDESQINFILISVRKMYVEVYLCLFRVKVVYLLKWWGNLVCSLSINIKMMT